MNNLYINMYTRWDMCVEEERMCVGTESEESLIHSPSHPPTPLDSTPSPSRHFNCVVFPPLFRYEQEAEKDGKEVCWESPRTFHGKRKKGGVGGGELFIILEQTPSIGDEISFLFSPSNGRRFRLLQKTEKNKKTGQKNGKKYFLLAADKDHASSGGFCYLWPNYTRIS